MVENEEQWTEVSNFLEEIMSEKEQIESVNETDQN